MKDSLSHRIAEYIEEADTTIAACREVFGDAEWLPELEIETANAKAEWKRLEEANDVPLPTIAFVGDINAGKSRLLQTFIQDPEKAKNIFPKGDNKRTGRLVWAGPHRPHLSGDGKESFIYLDQSEMADLGTPYLLLDTPGVGDSLKECGELANMALSSTRIKVLVVNAAKLRGDEYQSFISNADGGLIFPVVNRCPANNSEWKKDFGDVLEENLKKFAPHANIQKALCLPDAEDKNSEWSEEETWEHIRTELHGMLRRILEIPEASITATTSQLRFSYKHYKQRRTEILKPAVSMLDGCFKELEEAIRILPEKALSFLLSDSQKIRILFKNHFRAYLLENTPALAFPYRSLLGVLSFTTGAWDRLILGVGGSFPSLLLAGHSVVKGQKSAGEAVKTLRDQVKPLLAQTVTETVRDPLAAIRNRIPGVDKNSPIDFEINGVEELAATWNKEVSETAEENYPNRGFLIIAAVVATVIFCFLFGAPLLHLYGQYIPAAWQSWEGDWSKIALESYPSIGSGFWLTSLFLSIIPVFLIALCVTAWTLKLRRARNSENRVREKMNVYLNQSSFPLTVKIKDSRIEAIRRILSKTI